MRLLRDAILTVLNADADIRRYCGRVSNCAITWQDLLPDTMPILTVFLPSGPQTRESGDNRRFDGLLIACWSDEEHGGLETCERLADRVEVLLGEQGTTNLYLSGGAGSVDVAPWSWRQEERPVDTESGRALRRVDVVLDITAKKA